MPTYDYVCKGCGHAFELFQSMSAKPIKKCPECGANKAQRLIGIGAGIIFKGSGFYETDYRSDSYAKAAKAEKESASSSSESKSDTKSDTKSDGKADAAPAAKSAESKTSDSTKASPAKKTGSKKASTKK